MVREYYPNAGVNAPRSVVQPLPYNHTPALRARPSKATFTHMHTDRTNPHAVQLVSIARLIQSLTHNRHLIGQMTRREVIGRYKGSYLGLAWSFFYPLLMLIVYTFVFSEVFKSRWGPEGAQESKAQFALILFVGLIVLGLFSEVLNRAPGLIVSNINYVKRVVFPLEILPVVAMGAALFHALASITVLLVAYFIFNGHIHWTALLLPLVLIPLVILIMGIAWLLASLGVFIRDASQATGIVTSVMMFISPVFYPISAVPEKFQPVIMANPLTFIIEQARDVLIWGNSPNWLGLGIYMLASSIVAWGGFAWFQKTRKGFADVL